MTRISSGSLWRIDNDTTMACEEEEEEVLLATEE